MNKKKEVFEEFKHPDILVGKLPLELDFFYPELRLALEYQVLDIVKEV